ncbi:hypothetical protein E2C01_075906 [Portunus trituberculatus]|uniref:Uncharacterized protein n=1 Tax=Portunus trituberculatus TaxID=210409 RepID=A0A5B7IHK2_PORTR|nr:hypothetical protein [Portunus trituberculatus]
MTRVSGYGELLIGPQRKGLWILLLIVSIPTS